MELRIQSMTAEAEDIMSLELAAADAGQLPVFTAGAHIDVSVGNGLTRSYSLVNDQAERHRYVIAVNKDPASRGGSRYVRETLQVGQSIEVSAPRNHFPLVENAAHEEYLTIVIRICRCARKVRATRSCSAARAAYPTRWCLICRVPTMNFPAVPSAPPRKHRNLAHGGVAYLTESTRHGVLAAGDKLPTEQEIMRIVGVSRAVVREAISHLQAAGLVETRHGIGTFVLDPPAAQRLNLAPRTAVTMRDVLAVLELRISLETEAVSLAASRRSDAQLQQLRAALDTFRASVRDGGETVASDTSFHVLIARCSGNHYFHDLLSHLGTNMIPRSRVDSARLANDNPAAFMERVINEHEDIYNAIARKDPDTARAAMRTHLINSLEPLRRAQELNKGRNGQAGITARRRDQFTFPGLSWSGNPFARGSGRAR
jgi:GntR family transcriptional repressor for pyruvate dehydrogenase complex